MVALSYVARAAMDASGDRGRTRADARDLAPEIQLSRWSSPSARRSDLASGSGQWSFRMLLDAVVDLGRGVPAMAVLGNPNHPSHSSSFSRPLASPFFRGLSRSARFHLAGTVDADRFCWWNRVFEPERRLLSPSELVLLEEMQRPPGGEVGQEVAHPLGRARSSEPGPRATASRDGAAHARGRTPAGSRTRPPPTERGALRPDRDTQARPQDWAAWSRECSEEDARMRGHRHR